MTELPVEKSRISAAVQEGSFYKLQEGSFYSDYACSTQQCDETKKEDELIVLEFPVNNEHAFMTYCAGTNKVTFNEAKLDLWCPASAILIYHIYMQTHQGALDKVKLEAIQCEPCVWVVRGGGGKSIGVIILRVGDMMIAGDRANKSFLQKRKDTYSMNAEAIPVVNRGRKPTDGVSDRELSDLRGRLGTAGWRAQQSAPWLSAEVSLLQAAIPTATVSTIQKINRLIRAANDIADVAMVMPAIEKLAVVGWGDAAWAARVTGEPRGGGMIVLAPLSLLEGSTETVAPISWRSCTLPRVARSSASAEVQMMTETLDEMSCVRLFIYELECDRVDYTNRQAVNDAISTCPGVRVTDGKSGYHVIEMNESAGLGLRDKRTSVECLGIWQQKQQTGLQIRRVHSDAMLADGLTKDRAAKALMEFFLSGQRWRLVDDPLHRSARKRKSEGIDKLDHGTPLDPDTALEALVYFSRDDESQQAGPAGHEAFWGRTI
ncbi:unnamed protein product [Prorocentrum cordatum]|uniref:Uncharacterized protein n=1 Tax=Prorocentrum cordatum TaxID=2364126 RepID=A0ABN9WKS3_9DINO|nr:unnamed protein product [Polarella glacialis]